MKRMTTDQLRALALATGAEATIDGKPFNTARQVVTPKPITAAPPRAAAAPPLPSSPSTSATAAPAPTFTREQVDQMLAEQEERFTARLTSLLAGLQAPQAAGQEFYATEFTPKFDKDGQIEVVSVAWERLQ